MSVLRLLAWSSNDPVGSFGRTNGLTRRTGRERCRNGGAPAPVVQTVDWVSDPEPAYHGLVELFAAGIRNH